MQIDCALVEVAGCAPESVVAQSFAADCFFSGFCHGMISRRWNVDAS